MAKVKKSPVSLSQIVDPAEQRELVENLLSQVRPSPYKENTLSEAEKISRITKSFEDVLITLGLDLSNDSLRETPRRIAKMYVQELFACLSKDKFPRITTISNEMAYDQMVLVRQIKVLSVCEHHFQPIDGFGVVAYIPNKKVIGLSKINRIVNYFSRRPQVQERLTKQIADCLEVLLGTKDIGVYINAKHYCVAARGVEDETSMTTTSDLRGKFKNDLQTRNEFLRHCK